MKRLWAPWRLQYVANQPPKKAGCFFCTAFNERGRESENLLLKRGKKAFIMLNRYPYSNGHLMIAPVVHLGEFETIDAKTASEIWQLTAYAKKLLQHTMAPDGFNIGINQGKCAGAGVLDHLHIHIVPRWNGDANFMPVFGDCRVIPQALDATYQQLVKAMKSFRG